MLTDSQAEVLGWFADGRGHAFPHAGRALRSLLMRGLVRARVDAPDFYVITEAGVEALDELVAAPVAIRGGSGSKRGYVEVEDGAR